MASAEQDMSTQEVLEPTGDDHNIDEPSKEEVGQTEGQVIDNDEPKADDQEAKEGDAIASEYDQGVTDKNVGDSQEKKGENIGDGQEANDQNAGDGQDANTGDGQETNDQNALDGQEANDQNAGDGQEVNDQNAGDGQEVNDQNGGDGQEVNDQNAGDGQEVNDQNAGDGQDVNDQNAGDGQEANDQNAGYGQEVNDQNAGDGQEVNDQNVGDGQEANDQNAGDGQEVIDQNAGDGQEANDQNAGDGQEANDQNVGDGQEANAGDGQEANDQNADDGQEANNEIAPDGQEENAGDDEKSKDEATDDVADETQEQPTETDAQQEETQKHEETEKETVPNQENSKEQNEDQLPAQNAEQKGQADEKANTTDSVSKQEESSHHIEEKGTPEPPTEHMATGMDQAGEGLGPVGKPFVEQHAAPSPAPQYEPDATATVKFVLLPTQQVATLRCYLTQTLYELKEHFAQELKIPASSILFMLDGKGTEDRMTLGELGVGPNGTIRLEMQSADPENQPIKAFKPRQEYTMPDVISVRVSSDSGMKNVVVEIERANRKKPFLGGYRHKKTGVEYHHASAQTVQKPRPPPAVERFCRDTQTVKQKHMQQQTTNDMATQMTKVGVYVNNMQDKVVIPGKYLTADEYRINTLQKVIIIQKYYRRWLAKRYVDKVRQDQARRLEWEHEEELRKKKEKEDRIRHEFERRMNPKTKEDFDLLYHALEKWRQEEIRHINETLTGAERKAALCQLLDQETQLIASIGRHKLDANDENRHKAIQSFLEKASSPKKWKGPDGKQTEMDTPYTIRAQELRDIYNSINMKYLTQDERLDVLLTLKHTVKEHDCKLTQEIIELIDREADLLMRGVKESNLEGLRRRISSLFLQYIKTPTFNPEAARLLKVPQDPSTLRNNIYFCPSCSRYLPSTEFQLSSNSRVVGKCRKCNKMDNDARIRQDYSHYRYMLKSIRKDEESYGDESKIAFLMQENDLRYLVENIWNSQSVLSAWEDLYDLVLVRWERHQEWSPWNSILLTKEEATAHKKLERLEEAYGKVFIHKVKHKHTLARNYFSRMPGMAQYMRSRDGSALPSGPAVSGKAIAPTKA